jgi:hypothetical protein
LLLATPPEPPLPEKEKIMKSDELLGCVWFCHGQERLDIETDHPLGENFLTWRRAGQQAPSKAWPFVLIYCVNDALELHYVDANYCEGVRVYVNEAAMRLVSGEQYAHSWLKDLANPPVDANQLALRLRQIEAFEDAAFSHEEDDEVSALSDPWDEQPDPLEAVLERIEKELAAAA